MANELLDFVISLVRDPDVAARYAADPAGAIADAHLTGVTSADVGNLLPVVSDSLSMATPTFDTPDPAVGNVWTSGAATAAFDAFTAPDAGGHDWSPAVIDAPAVPAEAPEFSQTDTSDLSYSPPPEPSAGADDPVWGDLQGHGETPVPGDDGHLGFDHPHHTGFDIFE